jgi:hypothetical protein
MTSRVRRLTGSSQKCLARATNDEASHYVDSPSRPCFLCLSLCQALLSQMFSAYLFFFKFEIKFHTHVKQVKLVLYVFSFNVFRCILEKRSIYKVVQI